MKCELHQEPAISFVTILIIDETTCDYTQASPPDNLVVSRAAPMTVAIEAHIRFCRCNALTVYSFVQHSTKFEVSHALSRKKRRTVKNTTKSITIVIAFTRSSNGARDYSRDIVLEEAELGGEFATDSHSSHYHLPATVTAQPCPFRPPLQLASISYSTNISILHPITHSLSTSSHLSLNTPN